MLTLRYGTTADIPLIRALCLQVWPQTYAPLLPHAQIDYMLDWMYNPATLQAQLEGAVTYALCYDQDTPIGYAAWECHTDGVCKLEKLYVLPQQHGKGAGRFLLEHIASAAAKAGCHCVRLQVNKQNSARHFYEKLGFRVAEAVVSAIGNGFLMDDYIMQRDLC